MPYEDYKSRQWKVIPPDGELARCTPGDIVTFGGPKEAVSLRCKRYGDGAYEKESDSIVVDGYEIRMTDGPNGKRRITFTPQGENSIAGSWTAEDHGTWPGDD